MALIKCPECGNKVSTSAETCPHCGYPIKEWMQKFLNKTEAQPVAEEKPSKKEKGEYIIVPRSNARKFHVYVYLISIFCLLVGGGFIALGAWLISEVPLGGVLMVIVGAGIATFSLYDLVYITVLRIINSKIKEPLAKYDEEAGQFTFVDLKKRKYVFKKEDYFVLKNAFFNVGELVLGTPTGKTKLGFTNKRIEAIHQDLKRLKGM